MGTCFEGKIAGRFLTVHLNAGLVMNDVLLQAI
jgi:hypothetical protein